MIVSYCRGYWKHRACVSARWQGFTNSSTHKCDNSPWLPLVSTNLSNWRSWLSKHPIPWESGHFIFISTCAVATKAHFVTAADSLGAFGQGSLLPLLQCQHKCICRPYFWHLKVTVNRELMIEPFTRPVIRNFGDLQWISFPKIVIKEHMHFNKIMHCNFLCDCL